MEALFLGGPLDNQKLEVDENLSEFRYPVLVAHPKAGEPAPGPLDPISEDVVYRRVRPNFFVCRPELLDDLRQTPDTVCMRFPIETPVLPATEGGMAPHIKLSWSRFLENPVALFNTQAGYLPIGKCIEVKPDPNRALPTYDEIVIEFQQRILWDQWCERYPHAVHWPRNLGPIRWELMAYVECILSAAQDGLACAVVVKLVVGWKILRPENSTH